MVSKALPFTVTAVKQYIEDAPVPLKMLLVTWDWINEAVTCECCGGHEFQLSRWYSEN